MNNDTVELLKECNSGIKMGVCSIDEVLDKVSNEEFKQVLINSKEKHQKLGSETHALLNNRDESGEEPNIMAKGMAWLKTNVVLAVEGTDKNIAKLITDGCDMGTKTLSQYVNKYESASEEAKDIAARLIKIEDDLATDIRCYL